MKLTFGSEAFELLPGRAVHWSRRKTLIIADPHFGKGDVFRARGIPVPGGTTGNDVAALSALLESHDIEQLMILGDFWHAPESASSQVAARLRRWRTRHAGVRVATVLGNHDRHVDFPLESLDINIYDRPVELDGFRLSHYPDFDSPVPTFAGHLHPAIRLRDAQRAVFRAPCYLLRGPCLVLPAFGSFTGGGYFEPTPDDRVFLVGADRVTPVPPAFFM